MISGALAGLVGFGELLSRYRSSPAFSVRQTAAVGYVGVNAAAGALALYLVRAFGWTFSQTQDVTLWRVLVAGFGAVALFRSSLFVTKVGSTQVNVGPSLVLGALLDACDRSVDRDSATKLSASIADNAIRGLNPEAVDAVLPVICLALMQNFSEADQALLAADLGRIRQDTALGSEAKMRTVIIALSKYLGERVVAAVLLNSHELFVVPPSGGRPSPQTAEAIIASARSQRTSAEPPPSS